MLSPERPVSSVPGSTREAKRRLILLIAGAFVSSLGFTLLQERVVRVPGFTYKGWLVFLTYLVYACAGWAQWTTEGRRWHGRLQEYAGVAVLAMAGYYFTNWSLVWLDYPTRIAFKSSKMLPVMLVRSLVQRKSYSPAQYGAAMTLVSGIAIFTMGGLRPAAGSSWPGIALIVLALGCDALVANLEEARFFRVPQPSSQAEVACMLSAFAALYALGVMLATGELSPALAFSWAHWQVVPLCCAAALAGYLAVMCVLAIIQHHGATVAECVKSMRKVLQIAASLIVFSRPFSVAYLMGLALMVGGLGLYQGEQYLRTMKGSASGAYGTDEPIFHGLARLRHNELQGILEVDEPVETP